MILAAGIGKRMEPLSLHTPKPLLKVGSETLIEKHLTALRRAGFTQIVINLHHLGEKIEAYLGNGKQWQVDIVYSREPDLLETAGGIFNARELLDSGDEPFLVVNGDLYTDFDFSVVPRHLASSLAHLYLVDNPSHHPEGDFGIGADSHLTLDGQCFTYSGIGVYTMKFFAGIRSGSVMLRELMERHIAQGDLTGEYFSGFWSDVGTPERLQSLNEMQQQGE